MIRPALTALALLLGTLAGCGQQDPDTPPPVRIGDSLCDHCNMIISDERWATATVVLGPRGHEPRVFDDFNCQVSYEADHADLEIATRWSKSHASIEWIRTGNAYFLMSPMIRAPMGSKTAAFGTRDEAEAAMEQHPGEIVSFETAWSRLGRPETD